MIIDSRQAFQEMEPEIEIESFSAAPVNHPVTVQTVAERAGVSASTVSRILNGTAKVSDAKRASVEAAIRALRFRPNLMARSLAGGKTMSIGVLTQYIDSPFYGAGVRGIEEVLTSQGFTPIVTSGMWDSARERSRLWALIERKVDGLIVLTSRLDDKALQEISAQVPLVVTGRDFKARGVVSINFDNRAAGKIAAEHLLHLGHQNFAVITGLADHKDSDERLDGILSVVQRAGLGIRSSLIVAGDYHERGGHDAMRTMIASQHRFSAVIALNDQMAMGALLALSEAGLRVPEDVSVVGMDDLPSSAFFSPPLTTVIQPVYDMGKLAAELLVETLARPSFKRAHKTYSVQPSLVVRASTTHLG